MADYLSARSCQVEILEMGSKLAAGLNKSRRRPLQRLADDGVTLRLQTQVAEIREAEILVSGGGYHYPLGPMDGLSSLWAENHWRY